MGNGRYNQRDQPSPALHQQRPNSIPETIRLINRPNPLHLSVLLPGGHIDFFNHNLAVVCGSAVKKIKAGIGPVRFIQTISKPLDLTSYSPLEYQIYTAAGGSLASLAIRLWHR